MQSLGSHPAHEDPAAVRPWECTAFRTFPPLCSMQLIPSSPQISLHLHRRAVSCWATSFTRQLLPKSIPYRHTLVFIELDEWQPNQKIWGRSAYISIMSQLFLTGLLEVSWVYTASSHIPCAWLNTNGAVQTVEDSWRRDPKRALHTWLCTLSSLNDIFRAACLMTEQYDTFTFEVSV